MNSTYHSSTNWNSSQLFRKKNLPHQNCLLPFLSNQIETTVLVHGSAHHPRVSLHHPTHILNRSSRYHEVRTMMSGCPWNHECSLKTKKAVAMPILNFILSKIIILFSLKFSPQTSRNPSCLYKNIHTLYPSGYTWMIGDAQLSAKDLTVGWARASSSV